MVRVFSFFSLTLHIKLLSSLDDNALAKNISLKSSFSLVKPREGVVQGVNLLRIIYPKHGRSNSSFKP